MSWYCRDPRWRWRSEAFGLSRYSGLAYTYTNGTNFQRGFVASGGYTGTAVLGMILLLFRRTYRGPTVGIIGLGVLMLLSCIIYVRNLFGLITLPIMACALILCALKLKAVHVGYLYSFLAATCSSNAVANISELFVGVGYVNGEATEGDAHAVADNWGGTNIMWASLWFIFGLICSSVGLVFAIDGHTYKNSKGQQQQLEEEQESGIDGKLPKNELTVDSEIQVY